MVSEANANKDIETLAKMIKSIDFAMFTTATSDGSLHSRPMSTQDDDFDGDLWFFTEINSGKVYDIQDDQHVNVAYADPGHQRYISIGGTARLVRDQAKIKELWRPIYKAWFPKGLEDPNLGLIKVTVQEAEYWDSPSSKMVQLVGFVKALVTGKKADIGTHEKIDLTAAAGRNTQ